MTARVPLAGASRNRPGARRRAARGPRRMVGFAGSVLGLEWAGARAGALIDFVFGACAPAPGAAPLATLRLSEDPPGRLCLEADGTPVYRDEADGVMASVLLDVAARRLTEGSRHGLVLHAAALGGDGGRAVLLPGPTGAGKTTLALCLAAAGLAYLGDDLAFVRPDGAGVEGFPRPLRVREAAWDAVAPGLGVWLRGADVLAAAGTHLVRPPPGGPAPARAAALIVFAHYDPAGDGRPAGLTPAQAAMRLMETLLNARNLPGHGLDAALALARSTEALAIRYRDGRQVEALVRRGLAAPSGA